MLRLALIVIALAGCAKKSAAPATTPAAAPAPADAPAPGGAATGAGEPEKESDTMKGDPCDGGESKGK